MRWQPGDVLYPSVVISREELLTLSLADLLKRLHLQRLMPVIH